MRVSLRCTGCLTDGLSVLAGTVMVMTHSHPLVGLPEAGTGAGMAGGRVGLAQVRAALAGTAELLSALPETIWQAAGAELGSLLGELDRVAALAAAGRVAVTAEAVQRGEVTASQCASAAAWVGQHAPSLASAGGAGQVAKCAELIGKPRLLPVKEAVLSGELAVSAALVVVSEFDKLRGRIIPEAEALVLEGLVRIGSEDGVREVRKLRSRLLAEHGAEGEFQGEQDKAAGQVGLSHPMAVEEGVWEYLFRADAEAKAVLEAAIGPLSAPIHPDGARDPRSAQQRRGQALVEVCRRVTAAAKAAGPFGGFSGPTSRTGDPSGPATTHHAGDATAQPAEPEGGCATTEPAEHAGGCATAQPTEPAGGCATTQPAEHAGGCATTQRPAEGGLDEDAINRQTLAAALAGLGAGGAKATLMVTMSLTDLQHRVGAATTLGSRDHGSLLGPETARRIACDARVIPMLLGSAGEVLDHGRAERLFTPAQARAVLLRDRHCSFPGCDIPGFWGQLHHVWHWLDGGPTDLLNAALLCARHHTIVHRDRLTAIVTSTSVRWDTLPGSYDRALARDHPDHPAA